jgi:hypothetical protein
MGREDIWCEGVDWILLAEVRIQSQAFTHTVLNLRVS